ncbi:hypothetical protein DXG01_016861 [Tephrocybe rancida]|nr:hypothetical protein DXG01_016861 [Tephrocybe rancida]
MPTVNVSKAFSSSTTTTDGGLAITQQMRDIMMQDGFISVAQGGSTLRRLYMQESMKFDPMRLSPFGVACYAGDQRTVSQVVEQGFSPPLGATETPFKFGYASLVIHGAQRMEPGSNTSHLSTLKYLISHGVSLDIPDIAGLTALHHALLIRSLDPAIDQPIILDLVRELLKSSTNINAQTRYGETPLNLAAQQTNIAAVDLLLEYGADVDIQDADGTAPGPNRLMYGPKVTSIIQKWITRRNGEEHPPRFEKKCGSCGTQDHLKTCSRCNIAQYCSTECAKKAWSTHKKTCHPFNSDTTVTVKPHYDNTQSFVPTLTLQHELTGNNYTTNPKHFRSSHYPKDLSKPKIITIKVQRQTNHSTSHPVSGTMLVYTKNRDFVCLIRRQDGASAFDQIADVIKTAGIGGGQKAYFAAVLNSKDELVVKISQVLAELPF